MSSSANLWAITCYFNPQRYRRRLANYRIFLKNLKIPLITVELSFGGDFDLCEGDADILLQVREGDVLWQKERLLNLALAALPKNCAQVAFLDADVIFEGENWADDACRLLHHFPLIELFDAVYELGPDQLEPQRSLAYRNGRSLAAMISSGMPPGDLLRGNMRLDNKCHSGLAWAARREFLQHHGFYDACILGSGNRAMVCAALGYFKEAMSFLAMNSWQEEHYLQWARPFYESVHGSIAYLPGGIFHLWHGRLEDRSYGDRHRGFQRFNFNPNQDIALSSTGCWLWNSAKPEMQRYVREYFAMRKEDG